MKKKWLWVVPMALAAIIAVVLAVYHDTAYIVFRNLTVPVYELNEGQDWSGGTSYLGIPYADVSPSDYVDIYVPDQKNPPPLYVIIHGGGFISGDASSRQSQLMYRYFRDRGFACASVNYRLAQEAQFPAALEDCKAAIRFLRAHAGEYGYDASRIAVFGESAGGYLAVMCGVTNDNEFTDVPFLGQEDAGSVSAKVDVVVNYYGHIDNRGAQDDWKRLGIPQLVRDIANSWISGDVLQGYEDVESFWFRKNISEMTQEEYNVGNPHYYIQKNDLTGLSMWIVHGDCDITVPYLHSERLTAELTEKLGGGAVSYHLISGMGHASDPLYSDEELGLLETYLREKMGVR